MNLLFVGTMVPEEIAQREKGISAAGNRFQQNLVRHLELAGHQVEICSFVSVPLSVESERVLDAYDCRGEEERKSDIITGGALNYVLAAERKRRIADIKRFRGVVEQKLSGADAVLCYNVTYAWLWLPSAARKRKVYSIAVIADYSTARSFRNPLRKTYAKKMGKCIGQFDRVVGLSDGIRSVLRVGQEFIRIQGGIDEAFYDNVGRLHENSDRSETGGDIVFMYSGLLSCVTGVNLLLEAVKYLPQQGWKLVLTGRGELEDLVEKAGEKDPRITYLGNLPFEEYCKSLAGADILLNPRNMDLPENQNNFPSKVLDYLATGLPVISTRFAGWEEFQDYFYFVNSSSKEFADQMLDCLNRREFDSCYEKNRERAKDFLWKNQCSLFVRENP